MHIAIPREHLTIHVHVCLMLAMNIRLESKELYDKSIKTTVVKECDDCAS